MNRFTHWIAQVLRIPHLEETPEPEPNPYLDLETAVIVRQCMEAVATAVWPAVHQNPGRAMIAADIMLTNQLTLFTDVDLVSLKGVGYELAQMVQDYLDPDTDPETIRGGDWVSNDAPPPDGYVSIKAEIYAFVLESLEGDWVAAANVVEALYRRYYTTDDIDALAITSIRTIGLLSHLLFSLAHRFSLDAMPELMVFAQGADEEADDDDE